MELLTIIAVINESCSILVIIDATVCDETLKFRSFTLIWDNVFIKQTVFKNVWNRRINSDTLC